MAFEAADQALESIPPDQPTTVVAEGGSEVALGLETEQKLPVIFVSLQSS